MYANDTDGSGEETDRQEPTASSGSAVGRFRPSDAADASRFGAGGPAQRRDADRPTTERGETR